MRPPRARCAMYRGCCCGGQASCSHHGGGERIGIASSEDGWRGPFKRHNTQAPLCARRDKSCDAEDPFIWVDAQGHYHTLLHSLAPPGSSMKGGMGGGFHCDVATGRGCAVGSHAFSADGLAWTFSTTVVFRFSYTGWGLSRGDTLRIIETDAKCTDNEGNPNQADTSIYYNCPDQPTQVHCDNLVVAVSYVR